MDTEENATAVAIVEAPAPSPVAVEPLPEPELYLIARNPEDLVTAQVNMRVWAQSMVANMNSEVAECQAGYDLAAKHKWASARFKRLLGIAKSRALFYAKIDAALRAGYLVVPNFEMNTFMIRTAKKEPNRSYGDTSRRIDRGALEEAAQLLPQGEGKNQNPLPDGTTELIGTRKNSYGGDVTDYRHEASEWSQVGFPIALAKSAVMADGAKAAALKLFDEMGIAQDAGVWNKRGKGDPMLLGRLLNPRRNKPSVTFFIAWAIDLRAI